MNRMTGSFLDSRRLLAARIYILDERERRKSTRRRKKRIVFERAPAIDGASEKRRPTLVHCVKELRASHSGMTQQSLADVVGVTRQTIIALEGGAYTPSLALALRIAKVFGKSTDDVFHLRE